MNRRHEIVKELFKYTVLILIITTGWSIKLSAYTVNTTTEGAEIKWAGPEATYEINPAGGPGGSLTAIQAALQTWTEAGTAFSFIYGGTTTSTAYGTNDGINTITFGSLASGTLAENTQWYTVSTGEIADSDIRFNTDYPWSTDSAPGTYDVQNAGTHEAGHSLSLSDLYGTADTEKTMYAYISAGETKKRTLEQDDIDGIRYLYRASAGKPAISVRSAITAPGDTITIPVEINGETQDIYGFQTDLEITPSGGAPEITIDTITKGAAVTTSPETDSNPSAPASGGTVRIGLPVEIPAQGEARPSFSGPGAVTNIQLSIPADAQSGQSYQLRLNNTILAGPGNKAIESTVLRGAVTVGGTTALADSITSPGALTVGKGAEEPLIVTVTGGGQPVPGAELQFITDNPAVAILSSTTAATGADGKAAVNIKGGMEGNTTIRISAPGLAEAATGISVVGDTDGDGIPDDGDGSGTAGDNRCTGGNSANCDDNCRLTANSGQQDTDNDGYGNMCDADLDNDGFVGIFDFNIFKAAWLTTPSSADWNADADFDGDGVVGIFDFNIFKARWLTSAPWE